MFVVYVLYSSAYDKIYVGLTSNLEARLESHNRLSTKGWTIKYRPWLIIYKEEYEFKNKAIEREKELKTATGRKFIRSLIMR
jgi:putative endonuclease